MINKPKVKKNNFLKIMSCYDATSATMANLIGCNAILVGDSIGILNLGYKNTTDVNLKKLIKYGKNIKKIEGHDEISQLVTTLTKKNIDICTHIGITPQKYSTKKTPAEYARIAREHECSGAKLIVLSKMSNASNKKVSENVSIPIVGYKNTNFCNGKVDVMYAALGLLKGDEIKINIDQQSTIFKQLINFFQKNS